MAAIRVLFLGNSHTYYHDMPDMVAALADAGGGTPIQTTSVTGSGVDLAWHWNHRRSRQALSEGDLDFVVLQDRSGGPLENPASMQRHGELLAREARRNGARLLLYQTWARRTRPETQDEITARYGELAASAEATVVPVGEIWREILSGPAPVRLHDADDRHAGPAGSYVAALSFVYALTTRDPVGLPLSLERGGRSWVTVEPEPGAFIQEAVRRHTPTLA